jgi:hypothetical protein
LCEIFVSLGGIVRLAVVVGVVIVIVVEFQFVAAAPGTAVAVAAGCVVQFLVVVLFVAAVLWCNCFHVAFVEQIWCSLVWLPANSAVW